MENKQTKPVNNDAFAKLRVLIVEDNPVDRELLKALLEKMGFLNIQEARHGIEGVFKLENSAKINKPIHLLITDWKMPQKDGLSLVKFIRGDNTLKNIKIVMLTSVSDAEKVKEVLREGIEAFVLKPIDSGILQKKIESIVERWGHIESGQGE